MRKITVYKAAEVIKAVRWHYVGSRFFVESAFALSFAPNVNNRWFIVVSLQRFALWLFRAAEIASGELIYPRQMD